MNCWEILGIEPTRDRARIDAAYERQEKFASDEELERLRQAYREATGREAVGRGDRTEGSNEVSPASTEKTATETADQAESAELDASEQQVVREVVIQIRALLNDSRRSNDPQIWKAILGEPPADQPRLRKEIGRALESQVRPMAENGSFPPAVVQFLAGWFDWHSLHDAPEPQEEDETFTEQSGAGQESQEELPPQMVNFWPAVIGWIVGLAILAALFGGMGGGG
ncbi:J domain-containing protein [Marinobacter orientalis]|uniref:J domain-containing protein n=1 Tax=Marinobacter orientalis TaxID=1928859 RepID=A0A7Y0WTI7_9GAMM|nr:J domain-containing protein [Marinobacter orientalis]NMT64944.1 J domain-containing protein [Marinobacter orientalis]TGX48161.1 J domain-containing protein [Marinobacter orientalis]